MEIGLRNDIPTYSGGLGGLAGDTVQSAADLGLPLVAVTLVSRAGYFRQQIDDAGRQVELPDPWHPEDFASQLNARVVVPIDGREVWVRGWLYIVPGAAEGGTPVILLDTDLADNVAEDRRITDALYGDGDDYRLQQEIVLGIGGARLLHALGFRIRRYHLNEGHSAFLGLELLNRFSYPAADLRPGEGPYDIPRVREHCIFTTHTPVEAGHDRFPCEQVLRHLGDFVDPETLRRLGGRDELNMTRLALNLSEYVNGVAQRHAEVSRQRYPGQTVHAITNGVHPGRWTSAAFAQLYDRHVAGWRLETERLVRADCIPDAQLWEAHRAAKAKLIECVLARTGVRFDAEHPILGFARRMTGYKRPDLLFSDIERLRAIARRRPLQIVLAGKAHPRDELGRQLIQRLHELIRALAGEIAVAFLPNYDMELARLLAAGSDVWLNTPQRPLEASGTSGMKAALNGVPQLSVLDGWWVEGCIEGVTGWAIGADVQSANGDDAGALYEKLEHVVLPLYATNRAGWIAVMKGAITKNASIFNSHRMMRRYAAEAYLH
jgi:starch phosphorylase